MKEKLETQIAMETAAGREGLDVWRETVSRMTGEQKIAKAFELTEMTREIMREGIRTNHPDATEKQIQRIYIDRLLSFHGLSLEEIRRRQAQPASDQSANDR